MTQGNIYRIMVLVAFPAGLLFAAATPTPTPTPTPKKNLFTWIKESGKNPSPRPKPKASTTPKPKNSPSPKPKSTAAGANPGVGQGIHLGKDRSSPTPTPSPTPHAKKTTATPTPTSRSKKTTTPTSTPNEKAITPSPTPTSTPKEKKTPPKPTPVPTNSPKHETAKEISAPPSPAPKPSATPEIQKSVSPVATSPKVAPGAIELTLIKFEPMQGTPNEPGYQSARLSYRMEVGGPGKVEFPVIDFLVESPAGTLFQRHFELPAGNDFLEPGPDIDRTVSLDPASSDDWAAAYQKSDKAKFSWSIKGKSSGSVEKPVRNAWP